MKYPAGLLAMQLLFLNQNIELLVVYTWYCAMLATKFRKAHLKTLVLVGVSI